MGKASHVAKPRQAGREGEAGVEIATDPAEPGGPVTGLVLPGGGARGAYQAGVLRAIASLVPGRRTPFPVITGVSVGAINATWIARHGRHYRAAATTLAKMWAGMRAHKIYRTDAAAVVRSVLHWLATIATGGMGVPNPRALFDNTPLRQLLERELDFSALERALRAGELQALGVTASNYTTGRAVTFFQGAAHLAPWRRARRDGVRAHLGPEHLLASAALPFIFPAEAVGKDYFGDGSLRLAAPLSPAIHLGATRLFVIGVRDNVFAYSRPAETAHYPSLAQIAGYMLDVIFMDELDNDIERLCRINNTLSLLQPAQAEKTPLKKIDILAISPSQDIRHIARRHMHELPWSVKLLLRGVGGWQRDSRLPSYLLFEPEYCRALIELGHRDAMARRDEIISFLGLDQPASEPGGTGGRA